MWYAGNLISVTDKAYHKWISSVFKYWMQGFLGKVF